MLPVALLLVLISVVAFLLSFFLVRWRTFLWMTAVFALINSYLAAPLNWTSLLHGREFLFSPIAPTDPPIPVNRLALPTDSPQVIIRKMGCYVCHKIPFIPESRFANFGPVLIPKTLAPLRITSPEYRERLKAGKAHASTAKEYVMESILDPDAFIVPGFENKESPAVSNMYHHYGKRFTRGALDVLADHLLTLDVESAGKDGLIFTH